MWPAWAAMLLALALGAFIGFVNGLITLKAKIPSFIATLGAMMFWRGMLQIISHNESASMNPGGAFEAIFSGSMGAIQAQILWAVFIVGLGYLLLERHKLGNHIFGVGGNKESARAIGVYPNTVKMICFIIVGLLAAFAGVISTARVFSVSPDQGKGLELQAISACVIGGVSLLGGEGSILGLFLGAALLYTIQDVLLLLRAPGTYLEMFMGILIVVAVICNRLTKKEKD
jgi:ribose/xylose/arabinose/galactoside ABC-type transport system permease subunit